MSLSPTAQTISELLPGLTDQDRQDLLHLLGSELTLRHPGGWREANLGLLMTMLDGRRTLPTEAEYDAARESLRGDGLGPEEWPSAQAVATTFNGWTRAMRAAQDLRMDQNRGVFALNQEPLPVTGHSRHECMRAIQKCSRFLGGEWPDQWTYVKWAEASRDQARTAHADDPRLPGLAQIRKHYKDFAQALRAAQRDPTWPSDHSA